MADARVLMVTADDFGYACERDDGIIKAFEEGCVTQSSLLVNGSSVLTCIALARAARRNPLLYRDDDSSSSSSSSVGMPLGLHFNLTEGAYLSDASLPPMFGKFGFWSRCIAGDAMLTRELIVAELRAQIDRFVELVGSMPIYVDGHNHIQVIPAVSSVMFEVLPLYGIKYVRCPYERLHNLNDTMIPKNEFQHGVVQWAEVMRKQMMSKDETVSSSTSSSTATSATSSSSSSSASRTILLTSHHFIGIELMVDHFRTGVRRHRELMLAAERGVTEFMVHPGYPSSSGDDFSRSDERRDELDIICDRTLIDELHRRVMDGTIRMASWATCSIGNE